MSSFVLSDIEDDTGTPTRQVGAGLKTEQDWLDFDLTRPVMQALRAWGFANPTTIQSAVIPAALTGQHILTIARTGSGKTAAYLIPTINRLLHYPEIRDRHKLPASSITRVMVIVPTVELAHQCTSMCTKFVNFCNVTIATKLTTFQAGKGPSARAIQKQNKFEKKLGFLGKPRAVKVLDEPDIVVVTPGIAAEILPPNKMRLLDIIIFDEADQLLQDQFRTQYEKLLEVTKPQCQFMMFSATMKDERPAMKILTNPIVIRPPGVIDNLQHIFVRISTETSRFSTIVKLILKHPILKMIVFFNRRSSLEKFIKYYTALDLGELPQVFTVRTPLGQRVELEKQQRGTAKRHYDGDSNDEVTDIKQRKLGTGTEREKKLKHKKNNVPKPGFVEQTFEFSDSEIFSDFEISKPEPEQKNELLVDHDIAIGDSTTLSGEQLYPGINTDHLTEDPGTNDNGKLGPLVDKIPKRPGGSLKEYV